MEKNRGFCVRCNKPLRAGVICDNCVVEIYLISFISGKSVESYAKKYGISIHTLIKRVKVLRKNRTLHKILFEVVDQTKEKV